MSYIEKNLMDGENIIYRAKLHWIVFLWPAIWFVIVMYLFFETGDDGLLMIPAILPAIPSYINYLTSEFGVTNKRVIVKVGFIRRNSLEILLHKVEGIQVEQGVLARILNYGSIIVSGTGGTQDPFPKIAAPLEFRKKAQEQIATAQ